MLNLNKKGGDKLISVYWFVILIIVAGGIFAMVSSFYNHPYDVREVEAGIMINKISDCLSTAGKLNPEIFNGTEFSESYKENFLDSCNINLNFEADWEKPQHYFEINFYGSSDLTNSLFTINEGDKAFLASCNIQEEKEYKREVRCVEDGFFSFDEGDEEGKLYLIKILSVVRKTEKNVK